jgi:hypothetical protein
MSRSKILLVVVGVLLVFASSCSNSVTDVTTMPTQGPGGTPDKLQPLEVSRYGSVTMALPGRRATPVIRSEVLVPDSTVMAYGNGVGNMVFQSVHEGACGLQQLNGEAGHATTREPPGSLLQLLAGQVSCSFDNIVHDVNLCNYGVVSANEEWYGGCASDPMLQVAVLSGWAKVTVDNMNYEVESGMQLVCVHGYCSNTPIGFTPQQLKNFEIEDYSIGQAATPAPQAELEPSECAALVDQSASCMVTVKSDGTTNLVVGKIGTTSDFNLDTNECDTPIPPGVTCDILLTFDPKTTGQLTGTLTVHQNAVGPPSTVGLNGVAVDVEDPFVALVFRSISEVDRKDTSDGFDWVNSTPPDNWTDESCSLSGPSDCVTFQINDAAISGDSQQIVLGTYSGFGAYSDEAACVFALYNGVVPSSATNMSNVMANKMGLWYQVDPVGGSSGCSASNPAADWTFLNSEELRVIAIAQE